MFSVNSCKKETKSDLNLRGLALPHLISQLPEHEKVHRKEILDWTNNLQEPLPTEPFWDRAEQKVIVGKHVVRVPISDDASLYFTKEHDSLKVFVYKWFDKEPGKRLFTGNIVSYSFQDEKLRMLIYNKSSMVKYSTFDEPTTKKTSYSNSGHFGGSFISRVWNHITGKSNQTKATVPTIQYARNKLNSNKALSKKAVQDMQGGGIIGALWCWLTGGRVDDGVHFSNSSGEMNVQCNYSNGGGFWGRVASWIVDALGDGSDDGSGGGYIGSTPYNGDPGSSGNNYYVPPSGSSGGSSYAIPPYGGGAIWVTKWVPDPGGCPTPPGAGNSPADDPNGGGQPTQLSNCFVDAGHWERYQLTTNGIASDLINALGITDSNKQSFLNNNTTVAFELYNYLQEQGNTQDIIDFLNWAVNYLYTNPNVTIDVFKNQFLGTSEGQDGSFNEAYWSDPNLVIPKQNLPSWSDFSSNFPTHNKPNSIYKDYIALLQAIGGDVGNLYVPGGPGVNTCAIRVSYALVRSGITIPNIGQTVINGKTYPPQTLIGNDGKYYFIRAKELNAWMRHTFGTNDGDPKTPRNQNHTKISAAEAGLHGENLPQKLANKKGIYCIVSSDDRWASGHADLLYDDGTCGVNCHFGDAPINWIDIWVLQ